MELLKQFQIAALRELHGRTKHNLSWLSSPQAYGDFAEGLLGGTDWAAMTQPEYDAADALSAHATYEIASRSIWSKQVRDLDAPRDSQGLTRDEELQIFGLYEVFRCRALGPVIN